MTRRAEGPGGVRLPALERLLTFDNGESMYAPQSANTEQMALGGAYPNIEPDFKGKIWTGLDIIDYYSTYGHSAKVKVFHCNRGQPANEGSPYELLVVPKNHVNKQHYTFSASGVVYIPGPGLDPEFTPIGEWLRELSTFNLMRELRVFKLYLRSKTFNIWRTTARCLRFNRIKTRLESRAFLAKPSFCAAVMDLRRYVAQLSSLDLLVHGQEAEDGSSGDESRPQRLKDFRQTQLTHHELKVGPKMEAIIKEAEQSLHRLINEISMQVAYLRKEIDEFEKDPSAGASRGISTIKIKTERMEIKRAYRQAINDHRLLSNLVRMADYMMVESSVFLLTETVEKLRGTLGSRPVLITEVRFADPGMDFLPHEEEIQKVITKDIMESLIDTVKGAPRLLCADSFSPFLEPDTSGGVEVTSVIISVKSLAKARLACDHIVMRSFQESRKRAETFEDLRMIHNFAKSWDMAEYKANKRDVGQFRKDMMLLKEWKICLESMKTSQNSGCLLVDSLGMQTSLVKSVDRALDVLKLLLTNAAHKECIRVLGVFHELISDLEERPFRLDEFAAFFGNHVKWTEEKPMYLKQNELVNEMYSMLIDYGGKMPPNDQVNLDDLKDVVSTFNHAMEDSASYIDERKSGMISMLERNIKELYDKKQGITKQLRSGRYDSCKLPPSEALGELDRMLETSTGIDERKDKLVKYEDLFNMAPADFSSFEQTQKELMVHHQKWKFLNDFRQSVEGWMKGACSSLNVEEIQAKVDEFNKNNYKMVKSRRDDVVVLKLKEEIEAFRETMPLLQEVASPALENRHWENIFTIIGEPYQEGMHFCTEDLVRYNIMNKLEEVQTVSASASKEFSMLKTMEKMESEWEDLQFVCISYKDTGTFIIGGTDEIQMTLDDQIVKIQAMNASPFVAPFKARASLWEDTLQTLQDMLDNWLQCQSTWLYLEPIFSSDDIVKQIPEEGEKFRKVDGVWREIMAATHEAPHAIPIAREKERLEKLVECNELLDAIQKGLAAYLEKKRLYFPRFFFLSNDEMLEILSETKDPTRVQPHLKKCFEGVAELHFEENLTITSMKSVEQEQVPFKNLVDTVKARGSVEKWLLEVEAAMFESVHNTTALGIEDYAAKPRNDWVLEWPGMVVLVVTALYWTQGVEKAIQERCVKQYEESCTQDLLKIVDLVRGKLTKLQRATLGALVVMDVHARDVVTTLAAKGIDNIADFEWQAQLRSYWEKDESGEKDFTMLMRMMSATLEYGYEYLGNSSRLVITPLTDRCYRTLLGAIHLTLGGAPEGPAGTGKTETTKDLAKALARQCVVFNCSDSLDYIAMGKFFKGLASSGAWACFDEFNRIDLEVLSVVAQQVLDIQRAIAARLTVFTFEGTEMQLKWSAWCAITMNPGYAGRSELPDNLKALFRTVAMMVPDYAMISEIILFSFGYLQARECAKKIVQCYKLCSEQLSSQDHYDYGMRAVMAVLRAAGNLKQRFPSEDEFVLLMRSIIDVNLCKFLSHDVPLFQGIMSDLFPGVVLPKADYASMETALRDACNEMNLQPEEYFLLKTIQLYEMIVVRHGLMIVGLPFSGKTSSYRALARALTLMNERGQENQEKQEYHVINPKSVTMGQLYGQNDPVSHEWTDGVLAVTFRAAASDPGPVRKWLLLDGPVDAIWIENMNTVLDDNKKLCLNSGEIIQMSSRMNMIFEVMDLAVASPATVSRCGMVYLEPHQLGWRPLTVSWLNTLPEHIPEKAKENLLGLFDWLAPVSLRFVRREIKEAAPTMDSNLIVTLMRMITSLTEDWKDAKVFNAMDEATVRHHLESIFVFSLVWSIGCTGATLKARDDFDKFFRTAVASQLETFSGPSGERYNLPEDIPKNHVTMEAPMIPHADETSVYDYFFEKKSGQWKLWTTQIGEVDFPHDTPIRAIVVPTVDTVRYTYILDLAVKNVQPCLLVGPTGTGKGMTGATSLFRNLLLSSCIFWTTSYPLCSVLLRRSNSFRKMEDCQFVCAMGPPGGGRNPVTQRYSRHFNMVSIVDFDNATLTQIFTSIIDWFMKKEAFPDNVKELSSPIVAATLEVYFTAMNQLLPTPAKSHYTFNLRDISRVVNGLLMMKPETLGKGGAAKDLYLRLWNHEILRVFYDRLVDEKDQQWFLSALKQTTAASLNADFDKLFKHVANEASIVDTESIRKCFFGDYMQEAEEPSLRPYSEVIDIGPLISKMEEFLVDHNSTSKQAMNLAMFLYAVEHVSRVCRVLKQPGAHMLCVGLGGSGRKSLSRLGAYICGMETFQIEISKNYTTVEWREDLKKMTRRAGGDGQACVFLFSDTQIKEESFVEDINCLLNAGEVPNMFPYDERAAVLEQCRGLAKKEGKQLEGATELWNYFVEKTKENLHMILCFSPIGDAFRERLRQFPSLVNCCTIDWFQRWPNDALEAVAMKFLQEIENMTKEERVQIMDMCKMFHQDIVGLSDEFRSQAGRINYVTPTSYLELITMFATLLAQKRTEISSAKKRYEVGLEKLEFTAKQVNIMQNELTALKPTLVKTVSETEQLMATVQKEKTEVAEPKKAVVDEEVKKAEAAAEAANAIKVECEEALAEAIPVLEGALAALDTIKPADIKLVQSFKNPPGAIKLVMEAVCVLLDVKPARVNDPSGSGKKIDDYWEPSKRLLGDPQFVLKLKEYDKDNVPPKIIERIRKDYTSNPDFTPANAAKASSAAEGLCKWACAMDQYDKVAKVVAPKKAALADAEGQYSEVMTALQAKQADLKEVMDKLETLEKQLDHSVKEKTRLENEVELCTKKLERAEKLIGGLGGEKVRWTESATALGDAYVKLTGDMLISAGVISYLGAFTMAFRDQVTTKWVASCKSKGIPSSPSFSLCEALGDPVKIRAWGIAGLPNDSFSVDNGIMVANARRWPLMIDPQTQANKWVKNMEKEHNLKVIKLTDGNYLRTLENAIQFGMPVLLENVGEELEPSLEPLLLKQVFKSGGANCIRLGDSTIEYSDQFRFYITTALSNPHYLPETAVKVTLLNFMITQEGLSDQLLGVVVAEERPDLESQRQALVVESAENKRKLKEIEDKILHVLSSSEGNILEDATAIQILSEAKEVSNQIQEKEVVAEQTQKEIAEARTGYKPCGVYNAVLFFCIRDMAAVDPMYQYSLAWFIGLFVRSIRGSEKTEDLGARLNNINDHFTYSLYTNICLSLFEKDKVLFAFLLNTRLLSMRGELLPPMYSFLLSGGVGVPEKDVPNPASSWISQKAWGEICRVANVDDKFKNLPEAISKDPDAWKKIFDAVEPQDVSFEGLSSLASFEKLLVLRMLRPDKVVPGVRDFVSATLGQKFVEPPTIDLGSCYKESSVTAPLLFVLSPGSDPTAALLRFADDMGYGGSKISVISMGQGQGPKAEVLIKTARKEGTWVVLQNCHLAASWMPSLEKICEGILPENTDPDFRLWMTSMPSPAFPVTILQNSVKMTNEPPAGLKANLRRSYKLDPLNDENFFEGCTKPGAFKRLLFGLCFIHGFVQERRKFGPIGWNIPYSFDDGDLRISARQLRMYLDDNEYIPYDALKYAVGECNYGGRVTDDKDRRLLQTVLERVYRGDIMTDNPFKLSASGTYYVPEEGAHESYIKYIDALPSNPMPEVFGLHENANITKDLQETDLMMSTLLMTGGAGGGGGGGNDEELVGRMVEDILNRLPANFDIEKAQAKFPVKYEESMNQVLCQEMLRYNLLITIIRNSLVNLQKAIQGLQVMSGELDKVFRSLAIGKIPDLWKSKSFPSLKPVSSYVNELMDRLGMLHGWFENGQPSTFWISGFFFTPAFTTAALQNYARKHQFSIDKVGFDFEMLGVDESQYTTPPEDGVYVHGLFVEGCGWDDSKKQLRESESKVLFEPGPVIWLRPMPVEDFAQYQHYNCPVYRTGDRRGVLATTGHSTNFLMMIRLPTDLPEYHWTMRGVCMLCSLAE
ncbi:hypothetical protein BSKO_09578 [Bryopsis sp. KO-2023]|nr:hypothetical protein BSKO_09578 [Bryopsis sp. KO-2023]